MEGTPARLEMLISMREVSQFLRPYSSRYTPAATPNGTAVSAVTTMTSSVPTHADKIPARAARRDGKDVMNCPSRRESPLMARSVSRMTSVATPTRGQTMPRMLNRKSWRFRRASTVGMSCILVDLPESSTQHVAGDVKDEGQDKQGEPGRKNGLVPDAPMGQVPEAYLYD